MGCRHEYVYERRGDRFGHQELPLLHGFVELARDRVVPRQTMPAFYDFSEEGAAAVIEIEGRNEEKKGA